MYTVIMEIDGMYGRDVKLYECEYLGEIFEDFSRVQDLDCLVNMGMRQENKAGKAALVHLQELLFKSMSGELDKSDFEDFDIKFSLGRIHCIAIAEDEEESAKLKQRYKDGLYE